MSILSENSKKMLVESMRKCVKDVLTESTSLTAQQATRQLKYVNENATYEQLLNITMNPHREVNYLPSYVLEGAVAILHSACMTGRKNIGVNAITEGALKLAKKTGAVITESMLNAALTSVTEGQGLKVIGKILTEGFTPEQIALGKTLINYQANLDRTGVPVDMVDIQNKIKAAGLGNSAKQIINRVKQGYSVVDVLYYSAANNQIAEIKRALAQGGLNKTQLYSLHGRLASLEKHLETTAKRLKIDNTISDVGKKAAEGAQSAKTPWGKIALGIGAAGALGYGAYKYWKNNRDMERDRAAQTSVYNG